MPHLGQFKISPGVPEREGRFYAVERRFQRTLIAGFSLVLLLMLASGLLGLYAMRKIGQGATDMSERYLAESRMVDSLQRHQTSLGVLLYSMAKEREPSALPGYAAEMQVIQDKINDAVRSARGRKLAPDESEAWTSVQTSVAPLFTEIARLIQLRINNSSELSTLHRQFIASIARLMEVTYDDVALERAEILTSERSLMRNWVTLLMTSWAVALLCAGACVAGAIAVFKNVERQAETLAVLSVHTLAEQEDAARRFSQDMHDEFGQTLNAIESTLTVVEARDPQHQARIDDALALSKEAQSMAREMSQLLRPRILDDFGLDAALRELAHGFSKRTGIEVEYHGNFRGRLLPETETHLFRIAQEALTNTSRHSMATQVELSFLHQKSGFVLGITDNGGGFPKEQAHSGLGLLGMHERARAAGGSLALQTLHASPDGRTGVRIETQIPLARMRGENELDSWQGLAPANATQPNAT